MLKENNKKGRLQWQQNGLYQEILRSTIALMLLEICVRLTGDKVQMSKQGTLCTFMFQAKNMPSG